MIMKLNCKISIEFDDKSKAKKVLKSTEIDDFDFVKSKLEGKNISAEINSSSISSLIHTLDDYLSCISVAKKLVEDK